MEELSLSTLAADPGALALLLPGLSEITWSRIKTATDFKWTLETHTHPLPSFNNKLAEWAWDTSWRCIFWTENRIPEQTVLFFFFLLPLFKNTDIPREQM